MLQGNNNQASNSSREEEPGFECTCGLDCTDDNQHESMQAAAMAEALCNKGTDTNAWIRSDL
jgi:hypothetical protein